MANTLAAVAEGATQVQGTMNGIGERTGNANLVTIIANLQLHARLRRCIGPSGMAQADRDRALRRRAAQPQPGPARGRGSGAAPSPTRAACTSPACAPTRRPSSTPTRELVGNERELLVSELAGKHTVLEKAAAAGLAMDDAAAARVIERVKELEHQGYQFEAADGSFELLLRQEAGDVRAAVPAGVLARDRRAARRRQGRDRGDHQDLARRRALRARPPRATARSTRSTPRCAPRSSQVHPHLARRRARELQGPHPRRDARHRRGHARVHRRLRRHRRLGLHRRARERHRRVVAGAGRLARSSPSRAPAAARAGGARRRRSASEHRAPRSSRSPSPCSAPRRSRRSSRSCGPGSCRSARGCRRSRRRSPRASAPRTPARSRSGTTGLHLALRAVGVDRRATRSSPRRSRSSPSANAAVFERARPVFADIDPVTLNLDPAAAAAAITERTTALLPVHIFGYPADLPPSRRWGCRSSRTPARRSAPVTTTVPPSAARGNPAVFGFYANKQLTTGEGGMITLGDAAHEGAHRLRAQPGPRARHGLAGPRPARLQLPAERHRVRDRHRRSWTGWTTCSPTARASRRWYREALAALAAERGLGLPCEDGARHAGDVRGWFVFVVQVPHDGPSRDDVISALRDARRAVQALPAGDPPDVLLPRDLRLSRGRVPGLRGRRRALAGAAVLPADDARTRSRASRQRSADILVLTAPCTAWDDARHGAAGSRRQQRGGGAATRRWTGAAGFVAARGAADPALAPHDRRDRLASSTSTPAT